jgi:hypothetical protein
MKNAIALFVLLQLLSPLSADAAHDQTSTADEKDVIEIINSGSTNTAGFQIKIDRSGQSTWSLTGFLAGRRYSDPSVRGGDAQLSSQLTKQLFDDVKSAMPLSQFPDKGCAKSRSFGYSIFIMYLNQRTPDLTCAMTEPKLIRLKEDMQEVVKALHVGLNLPRRPSD